MWQKSRYLGVGGPAEPLGLYMVFKRKENSGQLERPSLPVLSMFQKSGRTHQLRLVIFPRYFFKFLYIPTVVGLEISEPSTVSSKTLVGRVS